MRYCDECAYPLIDMDEAIQAYDDEGCYEPGPLCHNCEDGVGWH